MHPETETAEIGTGQAGTKRQSLFRGVLWLPRDIAVGVFLLVVWRSIYFIPHAWIGNVSQYYLVLTIGLLLGLIVLLAYPIWIIRRRGARCESVFPGIGACAKEFAVAIPLTVGILVLLAALKFFLEKICGQTWVLSKVWEDTATRATLAEIILLMIYGLTLGPIAEEIFFRGFLYNAFLRRCWPMVAACLQAILFTAMHLYEWRPSLIVFLLGLILAGIYAWRKTLLAPIFVHAMLNSVAFIALATAFLANANAPALGVWGGASHDGIHISGVVPGSAADLAGIKPGDVIVSYGETPVSDFDHLVRLVRKGRIGEIVRILIRRNDTNMELKVTLRRRP
jgi:uncharacterized protein